MINRSPKVDWILASPEREWMKDAYCAGLPLDWFFPEEEDQEVVENAIGDARPRAYVRRGAYDKGREICAGCGVRDDCLTYALRNRINHGLWGGRTPRERIRIRRGKLVGSQGESPIQKERK